MKICNKCKQEKKSSEFSKDNSKKDGLCYCCKKCASEYGKKWYFENKEYHNKINQEWYQNNKEYHNKKSYEWHKSNKKYHNKINQEWYQNNKEHVKKRIQSKAKYNTFALQISYADKVRNIDGYLQTKCTYCGKWYFPTVSSVQSRIKALNGQNGNAEMRLYCSIECKQACPIYRKIKYQEGYPKLNENNQVREVQPELRQMVFERDNYTCLKCKRQDIVLHCHHIEGILWNPLESADIDQCMTVCKNCHREIHQQEDCGYSDLQCKKAA